MVASAHTTAYDYAVRGGSSAGRAPGLQPGGRGFESHPLHSRSDSMSPADWLRFLTELADRADELALRWFRTAGLRVQEKPDLSPVTEADQAIEAMARTAVRQNHPELGVLGEEEGEAPGPTEARDRKSTRLNSSHGYISYAVFCLKKKKKKEHRDSVH